MSAHLHRTSFSFVCLLVLNTLPALAQISTVNGQAQYSGTPVLENPWGLPTMVYNCAKVPSLCKNVNGNGGNYALTNLGNNLNGKLTNGDLTLHVDPNSKRNQDRRSESCSSSWKKNHVCPETDQPLVVPQPYNQGGRTVSTGFVGYALDASKQDYHIIDSNGAATGMAWTCDEFPPAFSVEGGQNGGTTANTYCAPMFAKDCNGRYTRSEQDFQSDAHGRIQSRLVATGNQAQSVYTSNIWSFKFKTEFVDDDDFYATRVDYYQDASADVGAFFGISEAAQKRSLGQKILVSHRVHGNGSIAELHRFVDWDHGMPNGTQPTGDPFQEPGITVGTKYLVQPTHIATAELEKRSDCSLPDISTMTDQPDEAAPTPVTSTFATYSCAVASVATSVGYN